MKMYFDDLDAAIEEAEFCAAHERRKYIIRFMKKGFEVFPKTRKGKPKGSCIEMGFKEDGPVDPL